MARAGECTRCGNLTVLNEAGLCNACKDLPRCSRHGDLLATGRCKRCRSYFCANCLDAGICASCVEESAEPVRRARKKAQVRKIATRALVLGGIVGLLAAYQGADMANQAFGPPSIKRACHQRLGAVVHAIVAIQIKQGHPPRDPGAIADYLRGQGASPPVIVPDGASPGPNAVIYKVDGQHFALQATDPQGRLYQENGHVLTITGS
ncbi:MAG TPA: hypothetical protein V6D47_04030 [Oscillatoriaceae cyanobacterium]